MALFIECTVYIALQIIKIVTILWTCLLITECGYVYKEGKLWVNRLYMGYSNVYIPCCKST